MRETDNCKRQRPAVETRALYSPPNSTPQVLGQFVQTANGGMQIVFGGHSQALSDACVQPSRRFDEKKFHVCKTEVDPFLNALEESGKVGATRRLQCVQTEGPIPPPDHVRHNCLVGVPAADVEEQQQAKKGGEESSGLRSLIAKGLCSCPHEFHGGLKGLQTLQGFVNGISLRSRSPTSPMEVLQSPPGRREEDAHTETRREDAIRRRLQEGIEGRGNVSSHLRDVGREPQVFRQQTLQRSRGCLQERHPSPLSQYRPVGCRVHAQIHTRSCSCEFSESRELFLVSLAVSILCGIISV
mmetsp:Transcript_54380/g.106414  ORF Transcript_54380/g.106414 Transcript_54380/m.106414 type:complete len:299 (-) Transcript_54380:853-1749(-)